MKSPENFQAVDQVKAPESSPLSAEVQQSMMQRRDLISCLPKVGIDIIEDINKHICDDIFGSVFDRCDDRGRGGRGGHDDRNDRRDRHDRDDDCRGDDRRGRGDDRYRDDSPRYDRLEEQHYQRKENRIDNATDYLKDNFDRLDRDNDGQVDRRELRVASHQADSFAERDKLQTLQENFNEIKSANRDGGEGITRGDVSETQRDLDRNREMRSMADRLHRGHPSLFSAIDGANGMQDGLISKSDLKEFKKDFFRKLVKGDLGGAYTPENMKLVGDMLNQWNHNGSAVNEMRDGDFISRRSLNSALEQNRYGDEQSRYAQRNVNRPYA